MRIFRTILLGAILFCPLQLLSQSDLGNNALLNEIESLIPRDRKRAVTLIDEAEQRTSITSSDYFNSHLLNLKGYLALTANDYSKATMQFQMARELAIASENKVQEAESYRREGILLLLLNQYPGALSLLDKSLKIHLQEQSPKVTFSLSSIVNIYEVLDQYEQQMEYSWLLLEEGHKYDDFDSIAVAHYSIGSVFLRQNDLNQASYHFEQQKIALEKDPYAFHFLNYEAFAKLELARGNLETALENIEKSERLVEEGGLQVALPSLLVTESRIRFELSQTELAIQLLNRSKFEAEQIGSSLYRILALEVLAEFHEKLGNLELSLDALKQIQIIQKESQINSERKLLAVNQAKLDLDTKNRQINQLKYEQKLSEQRQTNQFSLLAFTFLVIILLCLFVLRTRKQKIALKTASEEIQMATMAKSDFLARMSHEIRTPINAIIGLTKLSLRSSEDEHQATNLKQIEESSQTLLGLINDILDFSKIEAGKMSLESSTIRLDDVIDSSMRMNALKAQEKDLNFIKFISPDVPMAILGDSLRLQQVLNNLFSNAVKFTDEGSVSIVVNRQYSETDLLLQFEIKDTGRGLTSSQKEKLFESFSQADESITRQFGGTGLGLAISKQLVELMGGEIWVESVPSQGASFFFTIKTQKAPEIPTESTGNSGDEIRALVVDSAVATQQLISQTFTRMEITSDIAEDGDSAVSKIREAVKASKPYQFVVLDWRLPDIDGIEVTAILKQTYGPDAPTIILMANQNMSELRRLGAPLDVKGFLHKPLTASSLYDCIVNLTAKTTTVVSQTPGLATHVNVLKDTHVLLAEDNPLNRKVAIGYLKDTKAKVTVVENGQQAIEALSNDSSIDIVLMDIQMPLVDGLTATQMIRDELGLTLPIIAMTANAIEEDIRKSMAVGMNAHVIKPIDPAELIQTITNLLRE